MLLGIVLVSGCISAHAQLSQILNVAGEATNKVLEAGLTPQVPKNFKMPKTITSYSQYLRYAGMASGILPVTPEADAPTAAEVPLAAGPSSAVESALAPATAMAGEAQPSFLDASKQNYDPSVQDWADAYKPVDKALNKMFETRITNDNARQEQYELAVAAAPLQMLINNQVIKQDGQVRSFVGGLFGQVAGLFGGNQNANSGDTTLAAANPLTGTATTAPTAAAPAPAESQGQTVTAANPAAATAKAPAPDAAAKAPSPVTAPAPTIATSASPAAGSTSLQASSGASNALSSLFSLPSFGKRKLLAN